MQELDVSKPYRDIKDKTELEHISVIVLNNTKIVLAKSKVDKGEIEALYMRTFEQLENFNPGVADKPAFSWDKPICHIETGDKCVAVYDAKDNDDDIMTKLCVFKRLNGQHWSGYFSEKGLSDLYQYECELENYEPEERYTLVYQYLSGKAEVRNSEDKVIAEFDKKEDAELFKSIKEQGL